MTYLSELRESDATGHVAEVYADIRAVLGVPMVNLVYRHLAVVPGRLERLWPNLRQNLADVRTFDLANALVSRIASQRSHAVALAAAEPPPGEIAPCDQRRAVNTLRAYECANSRNLLAFTGLLNGCRGTRTHPRSSPPSPRASSSIDDILPMVDIRTVDRGTLSLLHRMSVVVAHDSGDTLIPSLFLNLATRPSLLEWLWRTLGREISASADGFAAAGLSRARELAGQLPHSLDALDEGESRGVLERFAPAIGTMIGIGSLMQAALGDERSSG